MLSWLSGLFRDESPAEPWPLSMPLMEFSRGDLFTLGDAVTGLAIIGGTGTGKTSASGYQAAMAYLNAGFGGLVLCAKSDEPGRWVDLCARAGRSQDLVLFSADRSLRYNFLHEEITASASHAGGIALNVVALLLTVLDAASRIGAGGSAPESRHESDPYWQATARKLLLNAVELLLMTRGTVTILDLHRLISSAPQSPGELYNKDWQASSLCFRCITEASDMPLPPERAEDLEMVSSFFLQEWAHLSPKTRGIVVSCVGSMTDPLLRGLCRTLFCTDTNVSPALTAEGKIIVVALPVKDFREVGLVANTIMKTGLQRWAERRDLTSNPRPIFLWCDEAPIFISSQDGAFQATCRSSRVATVMMAQTVASFHAALGGGEKGRAEADVLLGNLMTKVLHASGDPTTNQWGSSLVGNRMRLLFNGSSSRPDSPWNPAPFGGASDGNASSGFSEHMMPEVEPSVFLDLRTGGPTHGWCTDAIVIKSGAPFRSTGRHWMRCTFRQEPRAP